MNIKEAKNEIKNAVRIYVDKDENGKYRIPREKQRPRPAPRVKCPMQKQRLHRKEISRIIAVQWQQNGNRLAIN